MTNKEKNELYDWVYKYPTRYEKGFMPDELTNVLSEYPNIDMKKYDEAMMGNTCVMYEGKFCMYHTDVYHALLCGIEGRDLKLTEWD